jgi:hypothetical protein
MAFDKTPTTWLENWSEDGTDITVPLATFPELTAAEADATTGDIRKIAFAIAEKLYQAWALTASADRPDKMRITRTRTATGTATMVVQYTLRFELNVTGQEVEDED